ncbi:hypothetical protein BDA99DRAFT_70653 [Phascolomyces articulosus]|uniref:Uncharacterized protein n=1 Tax=Phascolomyces articulosus TaxID=60185 RepID=A0AAD5PDW9_9FUNG|nr:hypothetical protein BDA99DRAFT_70653 [Phascolomyces articulosus]
MSNEPLRNVLSNLATEKQIFEARVQERNIRKLNEDSSSTPNPASASNAKRSNTRSYDTRKTKKQKLACDNIMVVGLTGTLGHNLEQLSEKINVDSKKYKYFFYLSKNMVLDMTDKSQESHITKLHITMDKLKKYKYDKMVEKEQWQEATKKLNHLVKKVNSSSRAKKCSQAIDIIDTRSLGASAEEASSAKKIYTHIMDFHTYKQHQLSDDFISKCSEMSIATKFWSPIFETFFGYDKNLFIQWGDTLSFDCMDESLPFRLDIRMILEAEKKTVEAATAEIASHSRSISSKLYNDKLKSVLASKCHLNALLKKLDHLDSTTLQDVHIPIVQVLGLSVTIHTLSMIDKKLYLLQKVTKFVFPRTLKDIRKGGIDKVIAGLYQLKKMIEDLGDVVKECSRDTSDKAERITSGRKNKIKKFDIDEWISKVDWDSSFSDHGEDDDNESRVSINEVSDH